MIRTRLILIDGQRTKGIELAFTGNVTESWSIVGSYAYQDGELLSDQSPTLLKGATLAQVPENTFALWNRYDFTPAWGVGLGIVYRDEIFAATENVSRRTAT
jgi:catecholate siderophore receptor